MASLLNAFLVSGVEYPGRATHVKKVVAYLERTKTLKYRLEDIERVVEFLNQVEGKDKLREKLVARGLKQYPDSVLLNYHSGLIALAEGPHSSKARRGRASLGESHRAGRGVDRPQGDRALAGHQAHADGVQRDEQAHAGLTRFRHDGPRVLRDG